MRLGEFLLDQGLFPVDCLDHRDRRDRQTVCATRCRAHHSRRTFFCCLVLEIGYMTAIGLIVVV